MQTPSDSQYPNNDQAKAALEAIGDAVITTDADGRITYLNPFAESVTGWDADDALGQSLDTVLPLISESTREPVANTAARCLMEERAVDLESGVLLVRRDGTEVPIGDSAAPILDRSGATVGVVLVIQNESEKRRVGLRLSYQASHDPLTGLINRREFERRLSRVVAGLNELTSDHVLLWIDLDRFKLINDSCGHDAGDELLRNLATRLGHHLRKRDTLGRLGGDEFGVLLENCPLADAERVAEILRAEVEGYRFQWGGAEFSIGASIGLVPIGADPSGIASVLRAADAASYTAKEAGGNRVQIEHAGRGVLGMSHAMARRVTRMARAVDEGHFHLYGQPIVPLQEPESSSDSPARFEVLLRLPDSKGRMQAAADFLPQAERHHLMPAIDRWVVRETIAMLGQWHRAHLDAEHPVGSINLSASALADDSLLRVIEQQLVRQDVPPGAVCFEIAETAALINLNRTIRFVAGIRALGCSVALDDFGSGVSSFTSLQSLGVDFLKVGGSVVRGVASDPVCGSIVGAINQIGRSMGISTVAKQVGSEPLLRKLREIGIGYAQGRAVIPPVPLMDAEGQVTIQTLQRSA